MRQRASILVGLLWCLVLLSVVVIGLLRTATLELRLAKNHSDGIQAHYLALAGVEKAKALLYHDAWERRRNQTHHSGKLENAPEHFQDVQFGRGRFRVYQRDPREGSRGILYGCADEEGRLDLNRAPQQELMKLPGIAPEEVASILDYRDGNNSVTQGGAELEQYQELRPPSMPRNGPFLTVKEPLMVLGLDRDLFLGEDANLNGLLDPEENDGSASYPRDNQDGILDPGWSDLVTVHAEARNVNAAGESRVNIQQASESELAAIPGLDAGIARAIVQHRGQNEFRSIAELLDVRGPGPNNRPPPPPPPSPGGPGRGGGGPIVTRSGGAPEPATRGIVNFQAVNEGSTPPSSAESPPVPGAPQQNNNGPLLIDQALLLRIADQITVATDLSQPGVVNINTAPTRVLECLPGMTPELARAVVGYRASSGFFPTIAHLLEVPDFNRQIFQQLAPRVTTRSDTFRILSEGKVDATGATKRIQTVVRIGTFYVDTLAYREEDL